MTNAMKIRVRTKYFVPTLSIFELIGQIVHNRTNFVVGNISQLFIGLQIASLILMPEVKPEKILSFSNEDRVRYLPIFKHFFI